MVQSLSQKTFSSNRNTSPNVQSAPLENNLFINKANENTSQDVAQHKPQTGSTPQQPHPSNESTFDSQERPWREKDSFSPSPSSLPPPELPVSSQAEPKKVPLDMRSQRVGLKGIINPGLFLQRIFEKTDSNAQYAGGFQGYYSPWVVFAENNK